MSTTVHRCPNWVVVTTVVNCRRRRSSELSVMWFSNLSKNRSRRADLRTAYPISLRVRCSPFGCDRTTLLTELRPYPPNAITEATLNGLLMVAPTHRCGKFRKAPHYSLRTHHFQ